MTEQNLRPDSSIETVSAWLATARQSGEGVSAYTREFARATVEREVAKCEELGDPQGQLAALRDIAVQVEALPVRAGPHPDWVRQQQSRAPFRP